MMKNGVLLFVLFLSQGIVFAQGSSTGSSQLKIPLNARSAALSDATIADNGQLASWLINPANLNSNGNVTIALTHAQWIQDVQCEFLAIQIPISFGTVGLGVSAMSVPGIEIRDTPGPALGTFSARNAALQLGFAGTLIENLTLGISAKYLYEKLYADDASGIGVDVGLLYRTPIEGLHAAVSMTNTGSLEQFRRDRSDLPTFFRGGASYAFAVDEFTFAANAGFANNVRQSENHILGSLETTYNNIVSVRFGYASGYDTRALTAGLGIRYEILQLNYAFVPFSLGLGDAHLFTLAFQF